MTPTPEGKQLAADLANAVHSERGGSSNYYTPGYMSAANRHGPAVEALARLATEHLALKAELAEEKAFWAAKWGNAATQIDALKAKHEEALADLREIDALLENAPDSPSVIADAKAIAAKWRVETDPLVEVFDALRWDRDSKNGDRIERLRAELSKRGYEIGRKS